MSKRKARTAERRPMQPEMSIKFVVDETSDLHASDFVIPSIGVGERVLATHSDRPENNGIWVVRREGLARPALTKKQAPHLSIWADGCP